MPLNITSTANPRIKQLLLLKQKSSERRSRGLFLIEGLRELRMALEAGFAVRELYYCPSLTGAAWPADEFLRNIPAENLFEIAPHVFEKLAYRDASDGVVAVAEIRELALPSLELKKPPLLVVLESVEKPGNLGAILRTADAAGVDAVIVCDPLADIYNPNTIRASLGCIFTVQIVACGSAEALDWLKQNNIRIMAALLSGNKYYHETDMTGPLAIVMGSEAPGLTPLWQQNADEAIRIPMSGKVDSLNVSVSAAVLVFEARRQKGFRI